MNLSGVTKALRKLKTLVFGCDTAATKNVATEIAEIKASLATTQNLVCGLIDVMQQILSNEMATSNTPTPDPNTIPNWPSHKFPTVTIRY